MNNSFFNPENWLWRPFGKVTDILILSALFIFSSIPIVTIGSALTALYDCSAHCMKDGEEGIFSRYFRTFKREFLPSMLSFLFILVVLGASFSFIQKFTSTAQPTTLNIIMAYALVFILVTVVGIAFWVFPLLSRFTFSIMDLNLTAFRLAIMYLPRTIALGVCTSVAIWLCARFWIPLMFIPGLYGLLSTYILEPVFKKYEDI